MLLNAGMTGAPFSVTPHLHKDSSTMAGVAHVLAAGCWTSRQQTNEQKRVARQLLQLQSSRPRRNPRTLSQSQAFKHSKAKAAAYADDAVWCCHSYLSGRRSVKLSLLWLAHAVRCALATSAAARAREVLIMQRACLEELTASQPASSSTCLRTSRNISSLCISVPV